jgi:hypothetical protein
LGLQGDLDGLAGELLSGENGGGLDVEEYVCQETAVYEAAYRARLMKGLARKASELGYRLEPIPSAGM